MDQMAILGEYCYNNTHHMSIGMSPFKAIYGYEATTFGDLINQRSRVPGAKDFIQQNIDIMKLSKITSTMLRINRRHMLIRSE